MERRRELRVETRVHLDCRIPALPSKGLMLDISRDGCRLRTPMSKLEAGGTILLDLPGASRFPGRVVWINGIDAGVRFERPLSPLTSIALGIEQAEPALDETTSEPEELSSPPESLLRHWMRRIVQAVS